MNQKGDLHMLIYAYSMVWDTGFAPSVNKNTLSLACCKTYLRYKVAQELMSGAQDIYIIGLMGTQMARRHQLLDQKYAPVYIARIKESVTTEEYYSNPKYASRPDAQYLFEEGKWFFKPNNPHHSFEGQTADEPLTDWQNERDLYYLRNTVRKLNYVLLSDEYIRLGKQQISPLPDCIKSIINIRAASPRGDLRPIDLSKTEEAEFIRFFEQNKNRYKKEKTVDQPFIKRKRCGERKCR